MYIKEYKLANKATQKLFKGINYLKISNNKLKEELR